MDCEISIGIKFNKRYQSQKRNFFSLVERRNMDVKPIWHRPKSIKPKEKKKKTKAEKKNCCHKKLELEFQLRFLALCAMQKWA